MGISLAVLVGVSSIKGYKFCREWYFKKQIKDNLSKTYHRLGWVDPFLDRYYEENGEYPTEELSQIVYLFEKESSFNFVEDKDILNDPFGEGNFHYHRISEKECLTWSNGPNGSNDDFESGENDDIIIITCQPGREIVYDWFINYKKSKLNSEAKLK